MPEYNFQKRFAEDIREGRKRQTIRKRRKNSTKIGDVLHLYTGMRTKECRLLMVTKCKGLESVVINRDVFVSCTGEGLRDRAAQDEFARADGFADWDELVAWFDKTYGLPFYGVIVRW